MTFDDLRRFAQQDPDGRVLASALDELSKHFGDALPRFLADVHDARRPAADFPPDPLFTEAAARLADLIGTTAETARLLKLTREDAIDLLLAAMGNETVFPKPNRSATRETIGWLEVQWETSPAVLLADMREGVIPETRMGDAFLPDSIRAKAGMAGNRELQARDLYLARTLLESRPAGGVRFLYSRRAANQDPQLPSRLLLACPDSALPGRVNLIFGRPGWRGTAAAVPARPVLPLTPPACPPSRFTPVVRDSVQDLSHLSVPLLSGRGVHAGEDDRAREINIMDFGTLAHEVLRILKQHPALADEEELSARLLHELDELAGRRFGPQPPVAAIVQLESLRRRLIAAARIHAAAVREGWRIISAEENHEAELDGMLLRARIDRIDRHLEAGRIRILDYKTSDSGDAPLKTHFRPNSEERWADLQLPLYRFIYEQCMFRPRTSPWAGQSAPGHRPDRNPRVGPALQGRGRPLPQPGQGAVIARIRPERSGRRRIEASV